MKDRRLGYAVALLALGLLAGPAAAQELEEVPLNCEATPGGAMCHVAMTAGTLVYCVAAAPDGTPVANTTVASDDGAAAFNGVRVEEIATISCRVE